MLVEIKKKKKYRNYNVILKSIKFSAHFFVVTVVVVFVNKRMSGICFVEH